MAQIIDRGYIRQVLDHEISELSRIKKALNLIEHVPAIDNIGVALIPCKKEGAIESVLRSVKSILREADIIFTDRDYAVLLLPGTDEMGTIHILEGISDFLGEGLNFVYVVYPDHGKSSEELLKALASLAEKKLGIHADI